MNRIAACVLLAGVLLSGSAFVPSLHAQLDPDVEQGNARETEATKGEGAAPEASTWWPPLQPVTKENGETHQRIAPGLWVSTALLLLSWAAWVIVRRDLFSPMSFFVNVAPGISVLGIGVGFVWLEQLEWAVTFFAMMGLSWVIVATLYGVYRLVTWMNGSRVPYEERGY